ncbi:hypothetical protein IscW_ISCW015242 [Ixodes scapularis]|uniref:Uncharacterized protein n=1 Tax=Ixodes scapularis TaxID=6945 RepID=B7QMT8_IXOSC|nr:hypothetical protein IscW_ISCW015242 [Ixodes scapularis]|eukprot:XP_002400263.1 hypothetical protein IscW_ISCW015242 [Ixodes scapularis]
MPVAGGRGGTPRTVPDNAILLDSAVCSLSRGLLAGPDIRGRLTVSSRRSERLLGHIEQPRCTACA